MIEDVKLLLGLVILQSKHLRLLVGVEIGSILLGGLDMVDLSNDPCTILACRYRFLIHTEAVLLPAREFFEVSLLLSCDEKLLRLTFAGEGVMWVEAAPVQGTIVTLFATGFDICRPRWVKLHTLFIMLYMCSGFP